MQTYLLAMNTMTLATLLLGFDQFRHQTWRLWPLFLLVISQLLHLILVIADPQIEMLPLITSVLTVLSTLCITWLVIPPIDSFAGHQQKIFPIGLSLSVLLLILPALSIPHEYCNILIIISGISLILMSQYQEQQFPRLLTLLTLVLANLLQILGFISITWFVNLLAFVFLLRVLSFKALPETGTLFPTIPPLSSTQPTIERVLDISRMLYLLPHSERCFEKIARIVGQTVQVDQVALFTVDYMSSEQGKLAALYLSNTASLPSQRLSGTTISIKDFPVLGDVLDTEQPLLLSPSNENRLDSLYTLWQEEQTGPTLLQPLIVQKKPIGILLMGNPTTQHQIDSQTMKLCDLLAPQIATVMAHHRQHQRTKSAQNIQQDEYLAIMESINDGVVISNETGRVQLVNKAAERILGQPQRELLGQPIGMIYGQIDSGEAIENLAAAFSRQHKPLPTFLEKEGRVIQGRLLPWRSDTGEWMGIITTFRDITKEKQAEQAKDQFISALSYELRSSLTVVKGYTDLIANSMLSDYNAQQKKMHRVIQSNVDHITALLDNAVHFKTPHYEQLDFEPVDMAGVIDRALQNILPTAKLRKIHLRKDVPPGLPAVTGSAKHLRTILDNLLSNACKFTPKTGQITVKARSHSKQFGSLVRPELLISVTDTGLGMAESEHRRIFEPFYKAADSRIVEHKGLGMGLTVVKELVELHRGQVSVESAVDRGTTITLSLPLTQT